MKKMRKVLVMLLALSIIASFTVTFNVFAERNDVVVTSHQINYGAGAEFTFDLAGYQSNGTFVNNVTGINNYIKINDTLLTEFTNNEYGIHQRSNMFWIYPDAEHAFKTGDTIELLVGMGFGDVIDDATPCTQTTGDTLGTGYKIVMGFDGKWAIPPVEGDPVTVKEIKTMEFSEEDDVNYEKYKMSVEFTSLFSLAYEQDLQDINAIANNIKFNNKTINEINALNNLSNKLEDPDPAITIESTGLSLVFYIDKRAEIDNDKVIKENGNTSFELLQGLTTSSGLILNEAYVRTYYKDVDYWVTTVSDEILPSGNKILTFNSIGNDYGIGGDQTNAYIQILFNENICEGNSNFYSSIPSWVLSNATGRTVESMDYAISTGTYQSLINNFIFDGKSIKEIQEDITGDAAKSIALMTHYNNNSLDVYISTTTLDKMQAHTILLKQGLTCPTGYYVANDITFSYNATTGKFSVEPVVTGITLDKTSENISIDEQVTLTATIAPENAINKNIIWSSANEEIATVENGIVTGVALGSTIITATTEDGAYTVEFTVNVIIKTISITLNKTNLTLTEEDTDKITASFNPSNATNQVLTYISSDESIVTVDSEGNVTAIKEGTAVITVSNAESIEAQCAITVNAKEEAKGGCSGSNNISNILLVAVIAGLAMLFCNKKKLAK